VNATSCSTRGTRHVTFVIKPVISKGVNCDYDKRNISVVMCDIDIP